MKAIRVPIGSLRMLVAAGCAAVSIFFQSSASSAQVTPPQTSQAATPAQTPAAAAPVGCTNVPDLPLSLRFAEALIEAHDYDRALQSLQASSTASALPETTKSCIAHLFKVALKKQTATREDEKSLLSRLFRWFERWLPAAAGIMSSILFLALVCKAIAAWQSRNRAPWRFRRFEDSTGLGIADDVGASLRNVTARDSRETQSAGLLNLPAMTMPAASILTDNGADIKWTEMLADAPSVQGVSPKWVGHLMDGLTRLLIARAPTISGWAKIDGERLLIRLTAQRAGHSPKTVFREVGSRQDREAVLTAVEEVAITMHYLLAARPADRDVDSAILLRKGVAALNEHIRHQRYDALNKAASTFESIRSINPSDMEATLYEGLACELLEQHERAFNLFEEVRNSTNDVTLRSRADYNVAVTQLRRYTPTSLDSAQKTLNDLIAKENTPHAVRCFARATLANVIANKSIFWKHGLPEQPQDPDALHKWQTTAKARVGGWAEEVEKILSQLPAQLPDKTTRRKEQTAQENKLTRQEEIQLRWLIENARGNVALNRAIYLGTPDSGFESDVDAIQESLATAEGHYRRCELLAAPGVETLTNLATVLLRQKKYSETIEYCQRARALNPNYEYAYYREAQAVLGKDGKDACHTFLSDEAQALRRVKIDGFRKMFEDTGVPVPER